MVQTQGQRGDLHQYSHPYKINRDRGIELLAESMDANQELASSFHQYSVTAEEAAFRSHMSDVGKLRFYQSKPIADQMIGAVFCDSVRRRSFGHGMRVPRHVASVATRNRT